MLVIQDQDIDETVSCSNKTITILFWNTFWIWPDFGMGLGTSGFMEHNCTCFNCFTTTDRKLASVADAIIFHGQTLSEANIDDLQSIKNQRLDRGTGCPLFIYYHEESPKYSDNWLGNFRFISFCFRLSKPLTNRVFNDFFNLTMTYRLDSDIYKPSGRVRPKSPEAIQAMIGPSRWLTFNPDKVPVDNVGSRSKDIAWMVSNCRTQSKREDLVQKIQQVSKLKIDIYGKCGPRSNRLPGETSQDIRNNFRFNICFSATMPIFFLQKKPFLPGNICTKPS